MSKELIMVGFHHETRDNEGKLIIPASLFKIYQDENVDCLGEKYIATCDQVYARRNKKINPKLVKVEDFKGSKGISDTFYDIEGLYEFIEIIINDGYVVQRMTRHNENALADKLFKHSIDFQMKSVSKVMNF